VREREEAKAVLPMTILRLIDRALLRLGAFALTFSMILLDAVLPRRVPREHN
jgi:hypothetical protein